MAAASIDSCARTAGHQAWHWVPLLVGCLTLIAILALGGCGGDGGERETAGGPGPADYGSGGTFPVPREIEPNVDFWRHVYGIWSRNQVAIHDDEHMGVIYEVVRVPEAGSDGYSESQKSFVRARQQYHQNRLRDLQQRVSSGQPLSSEDKALLAKFDKVGGTRALYGAADRVHAQRGLRERFRRGMEISGRYDKAFREVMRANRLPEDLAYLPHVESSFQTHAVSSAGAAGVWQFMPATGRSFMRVNGAVDDRYDPILAADGAARYLTQAHNRLGSWPLAITSYNHGQGGMANAKAQYGHDFGRIVTNYQGKYFKFASRNYYAEFIAAREVAGHPDRYFPEGVRYESPWPHDRLVLRSSMPANQVASHYGVSTESLAGLNLHWRQAARSGRADLPAGSTVWLPAGSKSRVPGEPTGFGGSSALAYNAPRPAAEPAAAAAASMAFKAVKAEPVLATAAPRTVLVDDTDEDRPARPASKPAWKEPRIAMAEPKYSAVLEDRSEGAKPKNAPIDRKAATVEERRARPEPKTVLAEPKATKAESKASNAEPKGAKTESKVAKAESKGAKAESKGAKNDSKTAKTEPKGTKSEPKTAKTESKGGKADKPKLHVVQPQETLFRVASTNGLSVAELRKLNKMGPNDNSIRPGQKLKVGS